MSRALIMALALTAPAAGAELYVAGTIGEVYVGDPAVGVFEHFGGICLAPVHSLAIGDVRVYAGDINGGIVNLDLATGAFIEIFWIPGDATGLVMHQGDLLASDSFGNVNRADPLTGAVLSTMTAPIGILAMAIDGDDLYLAGPIGTVYKGDALLGNFKLLGGTCLGPIHALVVDETSVYAGDETGAIIRFDKVTGVVHTIFSVNESVTSLAMYAGDLLVGALNGSIVLLDADTGEFMDTMTSPVFVSAMELLPADGDLDGDGIVGIDDFVALLAAWGPCPKLPNPCPGDLDGDGTVGIEDFLMLLANWG